MKNMIQMTEANELELDKMPRLAYIRLLQIVLLIVLLAIYSVSLANAEIYETSILGDVSYVLYDDGKLVISGTGAIPESAFLNYNFWHKDINIKDVLIMDGVTGIGSGAFLGCEINSIELPDSLEFIEQEAFKDNNIESVVIPKSITTITSGVFKNCRYLKNVSIPDSVIAIEKEAFYNCSMEEINLPNSLVKIGDFAFSECRSLSDVTIPESVSELGRSVFANCESLKNVKLPSEIKELGARMFKGCKQLEELNLPLNLKKINDGLFENCIELKSILIPDEVYAIGDHAFYGCESINNIIIPESVSKLGSSTFENCKSLTNVAIPDRIQILGEGTFRGCYLLEEMILPNSLTEISDGLFENCTELKALNIPETVIKIGSGAFQGCEKLTKLQLPEGIKNIGSYAFAGCEKLTDIIIPYGVKIINEGLFYYCKNLRTIIIPDSVTKIGESSFQHCSCVEEINVPDSVTEIGEWAFAECSRLQRFSIPPKVREIKMYTFSDCTNLVEVSIPDNIKQINDYAFFYCSSLTNIYIPENVISIGKNAFYKCTNLSKIKIPDNVSTINVDVFSFCENLDKMYVPKSTKIKGTNITEASPIVFCWRDSDAEKWAQKAGYEIVYVDEANLNEVQELFKANVKHRSSSIAERTSEDDSDITQIEECAVDSKSIDNNIDDSFLIGSWLLIEIYLDGEPVPRNGFGMSLILNNDHTVSMSISQDENIGSWYINDVGELVVLDGTHELNFRIVQKHLEIEMEGYLLILLPLKINMRSCNLFSGILINDAWNCPSCGETTSDIFCPVDGTMCPGIWLCSYYHVLNDQQICVNCGAFKQEADVDLLIVNTENSMSDTLLYGDMLAFTNAPSYTRFSIVASVEGDRDARNTYYVSRLIGLPGDRVRIENGILYVNDLEYPELYINNDHRVNDSSNGYTFDEVYIPRRGDALSFEYTDSTQMRIGVYVNEEGWCWRGIATNAVSEDGRVLTYEHDGTLRLNGVDITEDVLEIVALVGTKFYIVEDLYFLMGDRQDISGDSRTQGPVSKSMLKGLLIGQWRYNPDINDIVWVDLK